MGPDLTHNGGTDAFVAKVNPSGTALEYAGYIGGSGEDGVTPLIGRPGIAVDILGAAYVIGVTTSTETTFPVTVGPDLTYNGDEVFAGDAFVAKVNPAGTALVYAGYIGGSRRDAGSGIAVDLMGNAYVSGVTQSSEDTFPVIVGPDLTYNGPGGCCVEDVFAAKVNPSGTALDYARYIGGVGNDGNTGIVDIAVDSAGSAYITSNTNSDETTFPVTVGPDLTQNGGADAFVAKISGTLADTVGPVTANVVATPNPVPASGPITLTANVDDATTGGRSIASAAYQVDAGQAVLMTADDGAFDEISEDVGAVLGGFGSAGDHQICVQGIDSVGNVGLLECIALSVDPAPAVFDLDIAQLRGTNRVSVSREGSVNLRLVVRNNGTVDGNANATLVGMQGGNQVYQQVLSVSDPVGNGRSTFDFPSFTPTVTGDITWTVTIDDDDPDIDQAVAVSRIVN